MDDENIVELFLCRDEAAISRVSEKYGRRLRAIARGITGDGLTAEECENDAYWQAWSSIPPHEPRSYLYAFMARITRHLALNRCRERESLKRSAFICRLSEELEQCIPAPDDMECRLDELALREALNGFLATLREEKRRVFLRRYWYLDSVADIAVSLGISESKVKTMLFRSRRQLKEYLIKEGYAL